MVMMAPIKVASNAGFLEKLGAMLEDESISHLIRWAKDGRTILILDPDTMSREVLPRYFKHNKFSSLVRQMNFYNFHKKLPPTRSHELRDLPDSWEFENDYFVRDHPELRSKIKRKTGGANKSRRRAGARRRSRSRHRRRRTNTLGSATNAAGAYAAINRAAVRVAAAAPGPAGAGDEDDALAGAAAGDDATALRRRSTRRAAVAAREAVKASIRHQEARSDDEYSYSEDDDERASNTSAMRSSMRSSRATSTRGASPVYTGGLLRGRKRRRGEEDEDDEATTSGVGLAPSFAVDRDGYRIGGSVRSSSYSSAMPSDLINKAIGVTPIRINAADFLSANNGTAAAAATTDDSSLPPVEPLAPVAATDASPVPMSGLSVANGPNNTVAVPPAISAQINKKLAVRNAQLTSRNEDLARKASVLATEFRKTQAKYQNLHGKARELLHHYNKAGVVAAGRNVSDQTPPQRKLTSHQLYQRILDDIDRPLKKRQKVSHLPSSSAVTSRHATVPDDADVDCLTAMDYASVFEPTAPSSIYDLVDHHAPFLPDDTYASSAAMRGLPALIVPSDDLPRIVPELPHPARAPATPSDPSNWWAAATSLDL